MSLFKWFFDGDIPLSGTRGLRTWMQSMHLENDMPPSKIERFLDSKWFPFGSLIMGAILLLGVIIYHWRQ